MTALWVNGIGGIGKTTWRIFVVARAGTFLLNLDEKGYSLEPGSTDGAKQHVN